MKLCHYHTEDCESPGVVYCHRNRSWYCAECAREQFCKCEQCGALDVEDDFEQNEEGTYLCPEYHTGNAKEARHIQALERDYIRSR